MYTWIFECCVMCKLASRLCSCMLQRRPVYWRTSEEQQSNISLTMGSHPLDILTYGRSMFMHSIGAIGHHVQMSM